MRNIEATGRYYVMATDTFMSGWGLAPGKSFYGVACDTLDQASDVERRMKTRPEFKRVRICVTPTKTTSRDHLHVVPFAAFTYGL